MQDFKIKFPFGPAAQKAIADVAVQTVTIENTLTILKAAAGFAQAVTALSLQAAADLMIGSKVKIDIKQNATGRNLAFGAAGSPIIAPALVGVASDEDVIELTWDGTAFVADTIWQKVFDFA